MPSIGVLATNSYVNESPGLMGFCVTSGTPSIANGTSMPWKCTPVDIGNLLSTTTRTLSPTFTLIHGPGTVPLNVHARTVLFVSTSQLASSAVRWNTFAPSVAMVGCSGALPTPLVFGPSLSCAVYNDTAFAM